MMIDSYISRAYVIATISLGRVTTLDELVVVNQQIFRV